MEAVAVREAGRDDLPAIDAIEAASFERDRFPRRNLARMLKGGRTRFFLADEGAGYLALSLRRGGRTGRIYSLAVHPDARGRGIAAALIAAARSLARAERLRALRLEVRESNLAARRLYEREGFCLRERRPAYYEDGEAALQLEAILEPLEPARNRETPIS